MFLFQATDIMQKVANFKNKKYAVAHGTADGKVSYDGSETMRTGKPGGGGVALDPYVQKCPYP